MIIVYCISEYRWNQIKQNLGNRVGTAIFSKSGQKELDDITVHPPTEADCEPASCNGKMATWVDCRCPDCR